MEFVAGQILSQFLIQEVGQFIGIEDQVEWIERELRLMQSSLEHVEANRQPVDDEIKWASEARDVIQEVENIIDVFLSKTAQYRRRGTFRRLVFVFNHLIVRLKLHSKVEKIKVQIRDVSKRRPKQPQESYSYQDRSSSSQAGPSTSHEPQIPHEAATAVASVIGQVNSVMSRNLLVHMGVIKIVRDIGDEFKRLRGILKDFKLEKKLDERTRSWIEEVKDISNLTEPIFASFIYKREEHLTHQRIFQFGFLFAGDLSFGKKLKRVRFQIHDLYRRKWTYGIGDLSEIPTSTASNITMRLSSPTVKANETFPFLSFESGLTPFGFLYYYYLVVFGFDHAIERMASLSQVRESIGLRRPVNDQLEAVKRDLRLMQGLFKDVGGMEDTGKRVMFWLDEMRDIARDIGDLLRQAEQENATTTLWKPRFARKIESINDKLLGISKRKWTYDIGKIEGRRSSEVEDQSEQQVEPSTPTAVGYHDIRSFREARGCSPHMLQQMGRIFLLPAAFQQSDVESLRRELKLMSALWDDANSMDEKNARLKVWTKQMQEVYEDALKFINSYSYKIEQKGVSFFRRYRFIQFVAPREINRIQNRIRELSIRKWTYDIGGIQPRKGQRYVGKPSTPEAHCMLISEPEAHCLSRLESAQPLSSRQIGRRNAFTRLFSFFMDTILLQPQLEENVKSIKEERSLMHSLLEDIGDLEHFDGGLAWVKDMKDVSIAVDAAISAYEEATKPNIRSLDSLHNRVRVAKKIEGIMHEIQVLSDRRRVYGIDFSKTRNAHNILNMAGNPHQRLLPSILSNRRDIVSFYDDLQAVVALLLANNEYRSIISIVGMEGIGKTTLVELLYENIAVRQHFTCNAWVSVHSDCDVEALMRRVEEQVLVSLQKNKRKPIGLHEQDGKLDAEEAQPLTLSAILEVNRYLIVLDDVSTTEIWDRLIKEFPSTLHGSRIVLITRDVDVATHADPKSVHKLRLLIDDDSWALFTKALTVPHGLSPHDLLELRKKVMRCGGLPRAIVQLREQFAGTESTSSAWLRVLENPKFDQKPWKKTLDMIKDRSLPLYLEGSLFYLRRFPADFEIPLRRLIALWIAEGLVHQRRGDEDPPEAVAERYLADLIDRNVVQATKKKLNGAVQKCRLPYALQEIWSLPEPEKAAYPGSHTYKNSKLSPTGHKIRHLTHHSSDSLSPGSGYEHVISFRSFDTREGSQPGKELGKFLKDCISSRYLLSLRVLDLERVFRPELPKALGELVLLRYLGLRWTYLEFLPSFIKELLNLQTLDVKHTSINTLPTSIWKMEQLRHLYLDEDYRCRFPEPSDYCLTDLQTLWGLFVDEDSPIKDGLDRLINLKRLGVTSRLMSSRPEAMPSQDSSQLLSSRPEAMPSQDSSRLMSSRPEAMPSQDSSRLMSSRPEAMPSQDPLLEAVANWVQKLKLLQSLRLKSFDKQGKPWQLPKLDLTGHTNLSSLYLLGRIAENNFLASGLPSALIELTLSGSRLTEDPMPKLGELPLLRILRLFSESFLGEKMLCPSGGFPQLRILKLWKLEKLEEWKVENGALSDLMDLEIRSCQNLKKLPDEWRDSRTLQIKFSDMPGEWDRFRNDRYDFHEDNSVNKYNTAETSIILGSQIREKLVKSTISKSKKIFLWKIASDELPTGSKECRMRHKEKLEETGEAKIASDELPIGSKECRMRHKEKLEETGEAKIASDELPTGSKECRMRHKEKLEETGEAKIASDEHPTGSKECPFCGAEPESAVHLFFLCKPVKMIWFAKWGIRTDDFSNLSIADWISNILTPSAIFGDSPPNETDFLNFAVIFMEKIWLWRNKAVTDHVEVDPDKIYRETCSSFMNMLVLKE
ncbi:hypothetical protein RHSIM_Rhsim02G0082100 [Rhododendron simsii]|uniref:Uncharacterized protein n=1 Tax=Rhododendron simsii TaxID=118357 RepID=A0A834H9H7_RHOSS|nr:hypothetical protein RHSIM_Rhsim02G0082100 [Rhododendron simsii]